MPLNTAALPNNSDAANSQTKASVFIQRVEDYIELTKPRMVLMILITTAAGFYLGTQGAVNWMLFLHTLIGSGLTAGGVLGLNQYLERDIDTMMSRTQQRPLPTGRLNATEALLFCVIITCGGMLYLTFAVNPLSGFVISLIVVSYLFAYTPMKRSTSLCTLVGAIPGALPPVVGWVAAQNTLSGSTWVLFAILFLWQLPHSLAIAYIYREDYANAGLKLLPVIHPDGTSTRHQIVINCLALFGVGLLPTLFNIAGGIYFFSAMLIGGMFLASGIYFQKTSSLKAARYVLHASLLYLPLIFLMMAIDKI
ncbi:MAG: heme o synthase [Candidatus Poribacteria bacterium]|nr:heme o synthase [Candidatus Poribacteria bacterium]